MTGPRTTSAPAAIRTILKSAPGAATRASCPGGAEDGLEGSPFRVARRSLLSSMVGATAGVVLGMTTSNEAVASETTDARFERGLNLLRQVGGKDYYAPIERLAQISLDLARFTVEYPYGDVLARPALDIRMRQLCTVAMLVANGSVQPQLRYHAHGFLNAGGEPNELVGLMFIAVALLGFPAAIDGTTQLRGVFNERGIAFKAPEAAADDGLDRYQQGLDALITLTGPASTQYVEELAAISSDLARWSIEFAFGEALSRGPLTPRAKLLAIIAMLSSVSNRAEVLRQHMAGALRHGIAQQEVIEVLMQVSVYAGFPAALNACAVAAEVFRALDDQSATTPSLPLGGPESRLDRRERGLATLAETSGGSGDEVVRSFEDIAPEIGQMIVEHSYGDVFSRAGIDLKTRELAACSALAAVATKTTETPLRVHINAALTLSLREDHGR